VEATSAADFTDPTGSGAILFCMYEEGALVFEAGAPSGEAWRTIGKASAGRGYKYTSSSATPDGVRKMQLKAGAQGKAKVIVSLGGGQLDAAPLGAPSLPVSLPLTVQVQADEGACWQAAYASAESNTSSELSCR
jgi:hypothetical protein